MSIFSSLRTLKDFLFRRPQIERDMEEELRSHLQSRADDLERQGLPRAEAERQARMEFGGYQRYKEECREALGTRLLGELIADARYGLRQLRRNPGFTAVAVITLALGIGANTAIFSVVYAVVLNPLPYPGANRLVTLWSMRRGNQDFVTPRNFEAWKRESRSFSTLAAFEEAGFNLTQGGRTQRIAGAMATADLFAVFGVRPALGRTFTPAEDRLGGPSVAVFSYRLWKNQFSADQHILGREVHLNQASYTVIGVMPPSLDMQAGSPELWAPLRLNPQMMSWEGGVLYVAGRLKPRVSLQQAQAEMNVLARNLQVRDPEMNRGRGIRVMPLATYLIGNYRQRLFVLVGAVGLVLLIACVNVANLLLARGTGRTRELAVRAALGASHTRILRQLLTETLLVTLGAAAGGAGLAYGGIPVVIALSPANVPRISEASINGVALCFTLILALLSTVLSGALPAWHWVRGEPLAGLQQGRRSVAGLAGDRLQDAYVTAEVALTLMLLTAAGLMIRTALSALRVKPGFAADHLLTARTALPRAGYHDAAQVSRTYERILDGVKATPGVVTAALTSKAPMSSSAVGLVIKPNAVSPPLQRDLDTELRYISPEYFSTLQVPILRGREFNEHDREGAAPVAIVNKNLARRLWPGRNAVGQSIQIPEVNPNERSWEVIGIAADVRDNGLMAGAPPVLYLPYTQVSSNAWQWTEQSLFLVIRTQPDPLTLVEPLRRAVDSVDPNLPFGNVRTMKQRLEQSTKAARLYAGLLTLLSTCGLLLACMGIYGVVAYFVSSRKAEIGIRIALGATPGRLLFWVMHKGMRPVLAGIGLGSVASVGAERVLASQLTGVSNTDPLTLIAVGSVLTAVALVACYIPARRAAKVEPMVALRYE